MQIYVTYEREYKEQMALQNFPEIDFLLFTLKRFSKEICATAGKSVLLLGNLCYCWEICATAGKSCVGFSAKNEIQRPNSTSSGQTDSEAYSGGGRMELSPGPSWVS